jgi:hypothetical protein
MNLKRIDKIIKEVLKNDRSDPRIRRRWESYFELFKKNIEQNNAKIKELQHQQETLLNIVENMGYELVSMLKDVNRKKGANDDSIKTENSSKES